MTVLMRVCLQENVWWFLPGSQKKVAVITRWLYYRGGRKVGFHCTKFKKFRKVYNLPFFSVLGHFFYPKFPLTSLTKIPSAFLFSVSVYLKEINTKNNVKYLYQNNTTCITWLYCNSLVLKKLESLKCGSFLVVHYNKKYLKNEGCFYHRIKPLSKCLRHKTKLKCNNIKTLCNRQVDLLVAFVNTSTILSTQRRINRIIATSHSKMSILRESMKVALSSNKAFILVLEA